MAFIFVTPLNEWLERLGCHHFYIAVLHPQSDALVKSFVQAAKSTYDSGYPYSFVQLGCAVDKLLLQCRNGSPFTIGKVLS